jgi:hypothetical protein
VGGSRCDGADSYPLLISAAASEIYGPLFRILVIDRRMSHYWKPHPIHQVKTLCHLQAKQWKAQKVLAKAVP